MFNTPEFALAFIAFIIIYNILPNKCKKYFLFVFNYIYAYAIGGISTILVLCSVAFMTYCYGLLMEKYHRLRKFFLYVFIICSLGVLFYGKYLNFFLQTKSKILGGETESIDIVVMIGISYYLLSAIGYAIDLYKEKYNAERNLGVLMLWLAFFPKLIAGPVEKYESFQQSLDNLDSYGFNPDVLKRGLLVMAWGYFLKIIIADRLSLFVDSVYADIDNMPSAVILAAVLIYSLQIYTDFAGYSYIALGAALAMGLKITNNFNHPYFAKSITEFWRRWHISLSTWLKEYIYIPLGGNRKGKLRQNVNLMITFLVSGLWHGAAWHYVVWGGVHGLFQVIEKNCSLKIKSENSIFHILKIVKNYIIVSFAWVFFRADTMPDAIRVIANIFSFKRGDFFDYLTINIDKSDWTIIAIAVIFMFVIELAQYKNISIYQKIQEKNVVVRWIFYYGVVVVLLIFGIYGPGYNASEFIYFKY